MNVLSGQPAAVVQPVIASARRLLATMQAHPLRWVVGLGLFLLINSYIAYQVYKEWDTVARIDWWSIDAGWLALAAAVQFGGLCIAILGWRFILHQFGYRVPFRQHFKIYTLSMLARRIPGIGWDVLGRTYLYRQHGGNELQVSVTTITEIAIFGLAGALVALVAMLLPGGLSDQVPPWVLLAALTVFAVLVPSPLFRRFLDWINRSNQQHTSEDSDSSSAGEQTHRLRWPHLFVWVGLNALTILCGGMTLFCFSYAFGSVAPGALLPLVQSWALIITSGTLLFWLPGGTNITGGLIILIFATMMPSPEAVVLFIAWRVWNMLSEIVWGGIGFAL